MAHLPHHRKEWLLAVALFSVAFLLRFGPLGKQSLALDEAYSWATARLTVAEILQIPQIDPHPPLYYLSLKATLLIVPDTEWGLRLLSALCSMLSLGLLFFIARRWWDMRTALYATWFATLSSFDLYYAHDARMYTLLGLCWLISYVLLAEACAGRSYLLIAWGAVNACLAWIHFYGLLIVATHIMLALGIWAWQHWRREPVRLHHRWLAGGVAFSLLGSLPVGPLLLTHSGHGAGGAWIPGVPLMGGLPGAFIVGLPAILSSIPNGKHLIIEPLSNTPYEIWQLLGLLFALVYVLSLVASWRTHGAERWWALVSLGTLTIPAVVPFVYGWLMQIHVWAFKPFVGAAAIYYLWMGHGLRQIAHPWLRRGVLLSTLLLAALCLVPYLTTWQKSIARSTFRDLPVSAQETQHAILAEPFWLVLLPMYYVDADSETTLWGIIPENQLARVLPREYPLLASGLVPLNCDAPDVQQVTDIWAYIDIRSTPQAWPDCLQQKQLHHFDGTRWEPLHLEPDPALQP
jgi:uncharacterized membrane protein